jgi:hypothetical protein
MQWLSPFFNMEAKFGPYNKKGKKLTSTGLKIFRRTAGYIFFDKKKNRNYKIFEELKVGPADEKLRR